MNRLRRLVKRLLQRHACVPKEDELRRIHEQNFGVNLGEWPERAEAAVRLLEAYRPELGSPLTVADWGCGKQTIRRLIPPDWTYVPYDRVPRSEDTRLHDFNRGLPAEGADVIFCLGLLEYVDDFWSVLGGAVDRSSFLLFSYSGPASREQCLRNGWRNSYQFALVTDFINAKNAECLTTFESEVVGRIFLVRTNAASG